MTMDNMTCPLCGGIMTWQSDFMREDLGLADTEKKDAVVQTFSCGTCGTSVEVYYPSDEEKGDYPDFWNGNDNNDKTTNKYEVPERQ